MFAIDAAPKPYLTVVRRRRGWGRVVLMAAAMLLVSSRFAYGGPPLQVDRVVVAPGDTVWSIAQAHYTGDPRPRVDQIIQINRLASPLLFPGETLQVPRD